MDPLRSIRTSKMSVSYPAVDVSFLVSPFEAAFLLLGSFYFLNMG